MTNDLQEARVSTEVLNEYRKIAAWLEAQAATRSPVGDTMHGLAAEALTNLIEHEYSRYTVPAADAYLPSGEQIAEVLEAHTLSRPNGGTSSVAWCDCSCGHREEMWGGTRDVVEARVKLHQAEAVRALFGEVAR